MEIPAPVLADGAWANDQLAAVDHVPLDVLIQESTGWLSARPGSRIRSEPKKRPKLGELLDFIDKSNES